MLVPSGPVRLILDVGRLGGAVLMLVIRIELWGAITRKRTELGVISIANVGGSNYRGNYRVEVHRSLERLLARKKPWRTGAVTDFPRRSLGAFDLLLRALLATVYDRNKSYVREGDAAAAMPGTEGDVYAPNPGGKQRVAGNS